MVYPGQQTAPHDTETETMTVTIDHHDRIESPWKHCRMRMLLEALKYGCRWECACGEIHATESHARHCRKCRTYLEDHAEREAPHDILGELNGES